MLNPANWWMMARGLLTGAPERTVRMMPINKDENQEGPLVMIDGADDIATALQGSGLPQNLANTLQAFVLYPLVLPIVELGFRGAEDDHEENTAEAFEAYQVLLLPPPPLPPSPPPPFLPFLPSPLSRSVPLPPLPSFLSHPSLPPHWCPTPRKHTQDVAELKGQLREQLEGFRAVASTDPEAARLFSRFEHVAVEGREVGQKIQEATEEGRCTEKCSCPGTCPTNTCATDNMRQSGTAQGVEQMARGRTRAPEAVVSGNSWCIAMLAWVLQYPRYKAATYTPGGEGVADAAHGSANQTLVGRGCAFVREQLLRLDLRFRRKRPQV